MCLQTFFRRHTNSQMLWTPVQVDNVAVTQPIHKTINLLRMNCRKHMILRILGLIVCPFFNIIINDILQKLSS